MTDRTRSRADRPADRQARAAATGADRTSGSALDASEMARRRRRTRIELVVVVALALVMMGGGLMAYRGLATPEATRTASQPPSQNPAAEAMMDEDARILSEGDGAVTLVQFVDFECEACRAVHPVIESLREQYAGRVTFAIKYFPLDGHFNAVRAARAVEAAAQQGKFEAMYLKMYRTQSDWGEQQIPMDELFRSFADELGLDLAAWDDAYHDPEVEALIRREVAHGESLGVSSTPAFFLNGERIEPTSVQDLIVVIESALGQG